MNRMINKRVAYQKKDADQMRNDENRGRSKALKTLIIIFCVLLLLLIGFGVYIWINYQKITGDLGFDPDHVEEESSEETGNYPEVTYSGGDVSEVTKSENVTDILLIGVDNRDPSKFTGLSDVIMFLRIDEKKGSLKLASVMRDTLVPIEGHKYNKINTAFNYGGIDLTKKTLKSSLGLSPDYYVVINFYGMEDLIDALGGVDIKLSNEEVLHMNGSIQEINEIDPDHSTPLVKGAGVRHLTGRQAVAYMRIRKVGTDTRRIERQQNVISELFSQAKSLGLGQLPGLISALSSCVRTDIKPADKILDIATSVIGLDVKEIKTYRYPDEYEFGSYKSMDIVQPKDFDKEIDKLHDFLNK